MQKNPYSKAALGVILHWSRDLDNKTTQWTYNRLSLLRNPRDPVKMFVESEIRFRRNAVQCVAKYEVQRHVVSKFKCKYKKNELWGYCNVLPRFSRHCQDSQSRLTFVGHSLQGCFICLSGYSIEDYMYMWSACLHFNIILNIIFPRVSCLTQFLEL